MRNKRETSLYVINLSSNFAVDRAFIRRTIQEKNREKSKELYPQNESLLNERYARVSEMRLHDKKKEEEEEEENHYIIHKDTFNILPIVRGVLSENTHMRIRRCT